MTDYFIPSNTADPFSPQQFIIVMPETGKMLKALTIMMTKSNEERNNGIRLVNDFYNDLLIGYNLTFKCLREQHFRDMERIYQTRFLKLSPWINLGSLAGLVDTAKKEMLGIIQSDTYFNEPFGNAAMNNYVKSKGVTCVSGKTGINCCMDQFIPVACCSIKRVINLEILEVVPNLLFNQP